jgi:hypothetical protein
MPTAEQLDPGTAVIGIILGLTCAWARTRGTMHPPPLDVVFQRIGETQTPLPTPAAVLIGLFACAVVALSGPGSLIDRVDTVAHEGAHALVGAGLGRRVRGVFLEANGDGATQLYPSKGLGFILALAVGYLGPSGFGLGAAKLIELGHVVAALWLSMLLLAALVPVVRNRPGALAVALADGLLLLMARYAPLGLQVVAAYTITWVLLLSGLRTVVVHGVHAGDAQHLASRMHLPKLLWVGLWFAGAVLALGLGGDFLV